VTIAIPNTSYPSKTHNSNCERCSSTSQDLDLLPGGHSSYKSQGHWRLTWLLTSGPVGLVEVPVS